jgi:hypothetical protein
MAQGVKMILLGKKEMKDVVALEDRKKYVESLLNEPRSSAGPSSQEYVSSEFWAGHREMLTKEITEIDQLLHKLRRSRK